jgi:site-specific recombinase XerD
MTKIAGSNKTKRGKKEAAITYAELIESYCEHLLKTEKSQQTLKNARAALKSWRQALRLELQDFVAEEFSSKFNQSVQAYKGCQRHELKSKSTYSSRISIIKSIRAFYLSQLTSHLLPGSFAERFGFLLRLNNYSLRKFHLLFFNNVTSYGRLRGWRAGIRAPRADGLILVESVEEYLQVPRGTLLSTLRTQVISPAPSSARSGLQKRYTVWTPKLEAEFQKLVEFKTSVVPPTGMTRSKKGVWTGEKGQIPPSALVFKNILKSFFGFLCLPADNPDPKWRGFGLDKNELSIALLADLELMETFLTVFWLARRDGVYNKGAFTTIAFVMSMLRKDTGYLYQKPDFSLESKLPAYAEAWQERCLETRRRLAEIKDHIECERAAGGKGFGFGRDPRKPIQAILDAPRPLLVVMKMVDDLLNDAKKVTHAPIEQAILYRDALLIAMLQANPLRLKMYEIMKFDENLVRKEDGSWWIKFKKFDFKNRHSIKSDYCVQVAVPIWQMIDTYKDVIRPRFKESQNCSHVFRLESKAIAKARSLNKTINQTLSDRIVKRTEQYIKDCNGFRTHAFRHIVATDIIKNNPGFGFFLAAKVLHDKPETVEENYAHLKTNEFYEPYNQIFTDTWNSLKSFSNQEEPAEGKLIGIGSESGSENAGGPR